MDDPKKIINKAGKIGKKVFLGPIIIFIVIAISVFIMITAIYKVILHNDSDSSSPMSKAASKITGTVVSVPRPLEGGSTGAVGSKITNNSESGAGWSSTTTVGNKTYRNYKQAGQEYSSEPYWGTTIAFAGCGPTSVAIILSGYGIDANPVQVIEQGNLTYSSPPIISNVVNLYDISTQLTDNPNHDDNDVQKIKENLEAGRPVIFGCGGPSGNGHFMTLLGLDENGKTVISDPGGADETQFRWDLEDFVKNTDGHNYKLGGCYILITSDSAGGGEVVQNPNQKLAQGKSQVQKCDPEKDDYCGYVSIFTSGTTGRQFKEYRQSLWFLNDKYSIPGSWNQECGTVSVMIIGSGYSGKANFKDTTEKLNGNGGQTLIGGWLQEYTGQQPTEISISKDALKKTLSDGAVAIIHSSNYSTDGHYMTLLDINENQTEVYLSNPWDGDLSGWTSIDKFFDSTSKLYVDWIGVITNNGEKVDYDSSKVLASSNSSSKYTSVKMADAIIQNGRGGYKININLNDEVTKMLDEFAKEKYDINNYITKANQKDYIIDFLKAKIITQYPDLRTADEISANKPIPDGELQGKIKVKRGNQVLTYIPMEQFNALKSEGNIDNIKKYFTMDSNNQIVVAKWEQRSTTITLEQLGGDDGDDPHPYGEDDFTPKNYDMFDISTTSINYLDQISKYSMPFNMLWTLTVYSKDEEFVHNISNMVLDTEIVITVQDNITTTTTTYVDTFAKKYTNNYGAQFSNVHIPANLSNTTVEKTYKYKVTYDETHIVNNASIKITYADTWIAKYENEYKNTQTTQNLNDTIEFEDKELVDSKTTSSEADHENEEALNEIINNNKGYLFSIAKENIIRRNQPSYLFWINYDTVVQKILDGSYSSYMQDLFTKMDSGDSNYSYTKKQIAEYAKANNDTYNNIKSQCINFANQFDFSDEYLTDYVRQNYLENQTIESKINEIDSKEQITKKIVSNTYQPKQTYSGTVKPKIDKNSKEDNFITYLNKSKIATRNLKSAPYWMFDSMKENEIITDKIDLMKYLLGIAFNKDYGVTTYEFDKYNEDNFVSHVEQIEYIFPVKQEDIGKAYIKDDNTLEDSIIKKKFSNNFKGILFNVKENAKVVAVKAGTVEEVGENEEYGKYIKIKHENNVSTLYAYLKVTNVKKGDKVSQGQEIGTTGDKGLYFEVYNGTLRANPLNYIKLSKPWSSTIGGMTEGLYKFMLTWEGGTQYIRGDQYQIFNNGYDKCIELTGGVVIGSLSEGIWGSYQKLISNKNAGVGTYISRDEYSAILATKYSGFAASLDKELAMQGVTVAQNQYDAMISYLWNYGHVEGCSAYYTVKAYKDGGARGLWQHFRVCTQYGMQSFRARRAQELRLFLTGDYSSSQMDDRLFNVYDSQYN